MPATESKQTEVILCGLGNIGSHVVPSLAREPSITDVTLIDRDVYCESNLASQAIRRSDCGKAKVRVMAGRIPQIAGNRIAVQSLCADLNDVPLGVYRHADVVIGCLDSQRARIDLAVKCWRAGRILIDTGVNADAMLARCTVFVPSETGPCYACGIEDWDNIEPAFACDGSPMEAPPSGAPALLGTAAAMLASLELRRLIASGLSDADAGRETLLVLNDNMRIQISRHRRNPNCRFDHQTLAVKGEVTASTSIGRALELAPAGLGPVGLRVEGDVFVQELRCLNPACGRGERQLLRLARRLGEYERTCPSCGKAMTGFQKVEWLAADTLSASLRHSSLRRLGLRAGDVIGVGSFSKAVWFEVGEHHD